MHIETNQPTEPTFTVTLSVAEMSVIVAAVGHTNCGEMEPGFPRPYPALRHALAQAGYPDPIQPARDAGLRVRDADGDWEAV